MTRNDYDLIAKALSGARPTSVAGVPIGSGYDQWAKDVRALAALFEQTNARFDTAKFAVACGVLGAEPARKGKITTKAFKVVCVSTNANNFGLRGFIVLAEDGEAWELGGNHPRAELYPAGSTLVRKDGHFEGFEIPRELKAPAAEVIAEVWAPGYDGSVRKSEKLGWTPA